MVFAAILILAVTGRESRMWQSCCVFAGAGGFYALLSAFLPAIAAFAHYGEPSDILAMLPSGAGLFHLPIVEAYRSQALDTVDIRYLQGVVTFPSFHAVMALLAAYALQDVRGLAAPAWIWGGLIIVSTIPVGGHYAIDLLAGGALWASLTLLVQGRVRPAWPGALNPTAIRIERQISEALTVVAYIRAGTSSSVTHAEAA